MLIQRGHIDLFTPDPLAHLADSDMLPKKAALPRSTWNNCISEVTGLEARAFLVIAMFP